MNSQKLMFIYFCLQFFPGLLFAKFFDSKLNLNWHFLFYKLSSRFASTTFLSLIIQSTDLIHPQTPNPKFFKQNDLIAIFDFLQKLYEFIFLKPNYLKISNRSNKQLLCNSNNNSLDSILCKEATVWKISSRLQQALFHS